MKQEKIIQYLKDANYWGENNIYFYTPAPQSFTDGESIFGLDELAIKYYIINKNEKGVGVIPISEVGRSIKELCTFIPNEDIKEIYIEKYKFLIIIPGGFRLVIKTTQNKVVEMQYVESENMVKFYNEIKEMIK